MTDSTVGVRRQPRNHRHDAVLAVGVALVLVHIGLRALALYPSWFYLDDYRLLYDASTVPFGAEYLAEPHNSNLMPGGRFLAWVVLQSGTLNWPVAASLILCVQAVAAAGALWTFVTAFGARWGTLVPLTLFLSSAMTVPVTMWWTAGVNQVPLQAAFFLALGSWLHYLRHRRPMWLIATMAAVALGLTFYVKALLILPVLAFVAVAYFATGGLLARLTQTLRTYTAAVVTAGILAGFYVGYYLTHVSGPFTETTAPLVGRIAETMIGTAFASAAVGGPWSWAALAPPNAFAAPPDWATHLAWVTIALTMMSGYALRERTMRAWLLLAGYLLACLALLVNSRGPAYGEVIGLEYRYLTDAAGIAAVCVGLVFLDLIGAPDSSHARSSPLWRGVPPPWLAPTVVAAIAIGGVVSSGRYVTIWHEQNASDPYVHRLMSEVDRLGSVDLADHPVPDPVIPGIFAPDNLLSRLTPLISDDVSYPDWSPRLGVVADDGSIRTALIGSGVVSEAGPVEDCGWRVEGRGSTIPLTATAFDYVWWLRIGYLYSEESAVSVSAGGDTVHAELQPGLNSLYVRIEGSFDEVRIDGIEQGSTLCVDTIEVGPPQPGGPL